MVAPLSTSQRIVCTAVRIDVPGVSRSNRLAYKPSELVPWADPYIAGLVRRLQSEVRFERAVVAAPASRPGAAEPVGRRRLGRVGPAALERRRRAGQVIDGKKPASVSPVP